MDYNEWTKLTSTDFPGKKVTNTQAAMFGKNLGAFLTEVKAKDEDSIKYATGWFIANVTDEDFYEHEMEEAEVEAVADQFMDTIERRHDAFRYGADEDEGSDSPPATFA